MVALSKLDPEIHSRAVLKLTVINLEVLKLINNKNNNLIKVLVVTVLVFIMTTGSAKKVEGAFATARASGVGAQNMTLTSGVSSASLTGNVKMMLPDPVVENDSLVAMMGPGGTISEILTDEILDPAFNVSDIQTYTAKEGDTLASIAQNYNLSINTLRWVNGIKKGEQVKPGQNLIILPVDGVMYTVRKGDTIAAIAKKFSADTADIKDFNGLDSDSDLVVGTKIVIPDGEVSEPAKQQNKPSKNTSVSGSVKGAIKKFFSGQVRDGYMQPWTVGRKSQSCHTSRGAIDIGSMPVGSDLIAAMDGRVIIANKAGYGGGYGLYVVLQHSNGSKTLYGHMSRVDVSVGDQVKQGQRIGLSGNTGRSTGPHLHWEIIGGSQRACDLW